MHAAVVAAAAAAADCRHNPLAFAGERRLSCRAARPPTHSAGSRSSKMWMTVTATATVQAASPASKATVETVSPT